MTELVIPLLVLLPLRLPLWVPPTAPRLQACSSGCHAVWLVGCPSVAPSFPLFPSCLSCLLHNHLHSSSTSPIITHSNHHHRHHLQPQRPTLRSIYRSDCSSGVSLVQMMVIGFTPRPAKKHLCCCSPTQPQSHPPCRRAPNQPLSLRFIPDC